MTRAELLKYFSRYSPILEQAIKKAVRASSLRVENLHNAVEYSLGLDEPDINRRGKRFRPALCLLACEKLGCDIRKALPFAVAIEVMHNYCLVHDDIEDGDTVRRGRPAVWLQYGLSHGINIGDFMISRVYGYLIEQAGKTWSPELTFRILNLMVETLDHTLTGQALDINARASDTITIKDYLEIVTKKTGYYLAAPIIGGAMIAGAPPGVIKAIHKFGSCMGPLFQIMDDIIDLTAGKGRNEIGADIKEGKRSFMVAHVNEKCSRKESHEMFKILNKPRVKTTKKDIAEILALFNKYEAIEAGREYCQVMSRKSGAAIQKIPLPLRDALSAFSNLLTDRTI